MEYKAVVADVDGTLIAPSEKPAGLPSSKVIEAIKKVQKKGIYFTIATGRSWVWVKDLVKGVGIETPVIIDNGAQIYDPVKGKTVWEALMPKKTVKEILSLWTKDASLRIFITDDNNRLENPSQIINWKIIKILTLGIREEKADELVRQLQDVKGVFVTKTVSGTDEFGYSVHVTSSEGTKETALHKLAGFLNINTDSIIGIGDSDNDFPLLRAAGLKVVMANASQEVKVKADIVAPSYGEDGVAYILEKYF